MHDIKALEGAELKIHLFLKSSYGRNEVIGLRIRLLYSEAKIPLGLLNKWLGELRDQPPRSGEKHLSVPTIEKAFFDWSRRVTLTEKPSKRLIS